MPKKTSVLIATCCLLLTAGCLGYGSQSDTPANRSPQQGTTTWSGAWVTIEDLYPDPFRVTVVDVSSNETVFDRTYDESNHETIDLRSSLPSDEIVVIEIAGTNGTLWKERVAPSVGYELTIKRDGTVVETLYEE